MAHPYEPRLQDNAWREQIEQKIRDEHTYAGNSVRAESDARDKLEAEIKRDFVSDRTLALILAPMKTSIERLEKALNWIVMLILGGFVAAVAKIVYGVTK